MNRPRFASDRPTFGGQKRGARCGKPTCAAAALLAAGSEGVSSDMRRAVAALVARVSLRGPHCFAASCSLAFVPSRSHACTIDMDRRAIPRIWRGPLACPLTCPLSGLFAGPFAAPFPAPIALTTRVDLG
ncbi:hypothetical protein [Burkholderia thailandensis]|uniref:hypothetical protein n=1 Tax=Burkholderia thailandensis TaxID=57975 RepID=UPI002D79D0D4|nr:hypothetical protein [Burkholderia thailandensis]WRS66932.1 hypothetical protein U9S59_06385 [Burkholderia thailandensis]